MDKSGYMIRQISTGELVKLGDHVDLDVGSFGILDGLAFAETVEEIQNGADVVLECDAGPADDYEIVAVTIKVIGRSAQLQLPGDVEEDDT